MSYWNGLLQAALVGTARQPMPPADGAPGEFAGLLQAIQEAPQGQLLRAAGVIAIARRAGHVAAERVAQASPAAAVDPRQALDAPAMRAPLADVLAQGPLRLQREVLGALVKGGWRLPHGLLPAALEAGRRDTDLRPAVVASMGERGLWLAGMNETWRYAIGTSEQADAQTRWDEGSLEQRRAVLAEQRHTDPAGARARLEAELPQLPAKDRVVLIGALAESLGPDDEAWLEGRLKDRAREVRQLAADLLQRLDGSAYVKRITATLTSLCTRDGKGWTLQAPEAADPAWKDDAIELVRPTYDKLGERGWWLCQLVRRAPLDWWTRHTGMTAEALLAWAAQGDWTKALVQGWDDALTAAPQLDWCDAMLAHGRYPRMSGVHLLALLPQARRERHLERELAQPQGLQNAIAMAGATCEAGETLSLALSVRIASALRAAASEGSLLKDHYLHAALVAATVVLHIEALDRLTNLPRSPDESPSLAEAMNQAERHIRARQLFSALPVSSSIS